MRLADGVIWFAFTAGFASLRRARGEGAVGFASSRRVEGDCRFEIRDFRDGVEEGAVGFAFTGTGGGAVGFAFTNRGEGTAGGGWATLGEGGWATLMLRDGVKMGVLAVRSWVRRSRAVVMARWWAAS